MRGPEPTRWMTKKVIQPLKSVIRMATPADEETERRNKEKEKEAFKVCVEKIKKHNLSMKLIDTDTRLTTIKYCSTLRQTEGSTSVSW